MKKGGDMLLLNDMPMQFVFNQLGGNLQNGCLILIPLFMVIKIGLMILKSFISPHPIAVHSIFFGVLLWVFVATYSDVIKNIIALANYIISIIIPPVDDPVKAITKSMNASHELLLINTYNHMSASLGKIGSGEVLKGIHDMGAYAFGAMVDNVKQTGMDFFSSLVSIFASLARAFMETVRAILLKFLILVGPLALTLSINEGFAHIGKFWLQKLFSVFCWSLTLNILDHLIIDYYTQVSMATASHTFNSGDAATDTPYFMDQLIVGFMYTMVPWLTGLYLGGFNSSHFLSNTFRMFSSLVTSALSTTHSAIKKP